MTNLVIVGGSDAGISAALRVKELEPNVVPTVIASDRYSNFSICGLPYYISHEVTDWRNLAHRTKEQIKGEGIQLLLGCTARSIDIATVGLGYDLSYTPPLSSPWDPVQMAVQKLIKTL